MEYYEAADFLFDLRRFRMKPGTASTARLLDHLGDPHRGPAYVQIAGSNGKGSTARMVDAVFREADLDVGLYTSPHFDDVRDRILVNDRPIPKAAVTEFVETTRPYLTGRAAAGEPPTFFEVLTAMALWQFGREGVDVAVIEVGIGGRHDATSVVTPAASAVTTVALEHTDLLGDTIEQIARDKAHVATPETPLVTGADGEALAAIRNQVEAVVTVGPDGDVTVDYGGVDDGEAAVRLAGPSWSLETRLPLVGAHQARNAGVAAALCRQVADIGEETLAAGLRAARWPGRFEVMDTDPLVILDGAHNPAACDAVASTLAEYDFEELFVVFGAMHDKDHAAMAAALPPPATVFVCEPNLDRAEDRDVLAAVFEGQGSDVVPMRAVETALDRAIEAADADDCVLVTGSLYTVGEARRRWSRVGIEKHIADLDDARSVLAGAGVTDAGVWRMRGKAVHRTVKTRLQPRQARIVKEELLSLGGECALSGLQGQEEELIDVVLTGTLAQFNRLLRKLDAQPHALPAVGDALAELLGLGTEPPRAGYPWEDRTAVMGVLNVTPDSFHDGGAFDDTAAAVDRAEEMVAAGADIVDVGGESTRPGADPVPVTTELDRVLPVIEAAAALDALVSVDTRKAAVARAALDAGADLINDVSGLEDPEMPAVAAGADVPLVVMHSIDTPVVPDRTVWYDDVVEDVIAELGERVLQAERAGLDRSKIIVDPGLGFGKRPDENFELLGRLDELHGLGCPVLVGHSHKSMFEHIGRGPGERGPATVAATALATARGADIVRVHDVADNVAAVRAVVAADDPARFDGRPRG